MVHGEEAWAAEELQRAQMALLASQEELGKHEQKGKAEADLVWEQAQVSRPGRGARCAAWGVLPTAPTAPDTKCPRRDAWL